MHFKPIKHQSEIHTMDAEVLWEEFKKVPEDLSLEEINSFFKDYVKKNSKIL